MCLEIVARIAPDAKNRISAKRLSELTGLVVTPCKTEGVAGLHFSVSGGCSCEFLADDADPEGETWLLSADRLPALSRAISSLTDECGKFDFIARWLDGEPPARSERIAGSALAKLVSANAIGNNVRYEVGIRRPPA